MQCTLHLGNARATLLFSRKISVLPAVPYTSNGYILLSHHCIASFSTATVDPALVPHICAVIRTGSLKTLGIGELFKPDQIVQVLEELPHCTHISELSLALSPSDKVRCHFSMQ